MSDIPDMIADPASFDTDAGFWLHAAQAAIRRHCGWHVIPNIVLSGALNCRGGTVLRLPARHVTEVESLTDRDGRPLTYAYDPATGLIESLNGPFPSGVAAVRFVIRAGWDADECPDVQGVLVNMAKRIMMAPTGVIASQSVNGSSVSYGETASLMQSEMDKLKPYRLEGLP